LDTVIILHGLWLHTWVVEPLRRRLASTGMKALSFGYPTMRRDLDGNARALTEFAVRTPGDRLHFVGHSLGGLVVLRMLTLGAPPRVGRTVLLGSPCVGSEVANRLRGIPGSGFLLGLSIAQWMHDPVPFVADQYEIAAIAGSKPMGLGQFVVSIEPPHDGGVRVDETRLPSLADHLILPVSHTGMLFSPEVARQTGVFLQRGRFDRDGAT